MIHLEAASASTLTHSCPSGNLLSGGGSGSATPDNGGGRHPEDIAMSLDELEKGRQADADRCVRAEEGLRACVWLCVCLCGYRGWGLKQLQCVTSL